MCGWSSTSESEGRVGPRDKMYFSPHQLSLMALKVMVFFQSYVWVWLLLMVHLLSPQSDALSSVNELYLIEDGKLIRKALRMSVINTLNFPDSHRTLKFGLSVSD